MSNMLANIPYPWMGFDESYGTILFIREHTGVVLKPIDPDETFSGEYSDGWDERGFDRIENAIIPAAHLKRTLDGNLIVMQLGLGVNVPAIGRAVVLWALIPDYPIGTIVNYHQDCFIQVKHEISISFPVKSTVEISTYTAEDRRRDTDG